MHQKNPATLTVHTVDGEGRRKSNCYSLIMGIILFLAYNLSNTDIYQRIFLILSICSVIYCPHCRWGRWEKKQLLFVMGIVLFLALPSIELSPGAMNSGHFFHLMFNAQWHLVPKLCTFHHLCMLRG